MYSTLWPQDMSTNQIWDSYVKLYMIYARDTIFSRSEGRGKGRVLDAPWPQGALTHEF